VFVTAAEIGARTHGDRLARKENQFRMRSVLACYENPRHLSRMARKNPLGWSQILFSESRRLREAARKGKSFPAQARQEISLQPSYR
jgi:hypothetical protein